MKTLKSFVARFVLWFKYDHCFKHGTPSVYGRNLGAWNYCQKCSDEWWEKREKQRAKEKESKNRWISWLND
jgi:hypothetical protein